MFETIHLPKWSRDRTSLQILHPSNTSVFPILHKTTEIRPHDLYYACTLLQGIILFYEKERVLKIPLCYTES